MSNELTRRRLWLWGLDSEPAYAGEAPGGVAFVDLLFRPARGPRLGSAPHNLKARYSLLAARSGAAAERCHRGHVTDVRDRHGLPTLGSAGAVRDSGCGLRW